MISVSELKNVNQSNIVEHVLKLARQNEIQDDKASIDYVANKFAELSGNEVYEDNILRLCINLARRNVITKSETLKLVHMYLTSRR